MPFNTKSNPVYGPSTVADPVVHGAAGAAAATTVGLGFDGIGVGLGSYSARYAPPDTTARSARRRPCNG